MQIRQDEFRANACSSSQFFDLISTLSSVAGDAQFRDRERDFSRDGTLTPGLLLTLLLYMIADANRRGYELLLHGFWDEARSHSLPLPSERAISAAAFCKARRKITPDLLRQLLLLVKDEFVGKFGTTSRWHGRRVFAVDGAKINLQRDPDLEEAFGVPEGAHCPQVLVSTLYDVCAKLAVDLRVSPYAFCERQHLLEMLEHLVPGDVLVLDRGYPSHETLQALHKAGVEFLFRVPASNSFKAIDTFRGSGGEDYRVLIDPPKGSPKEWSALNLRAVKLTNDDGEESFFLTTMRRQEFSLADIRELYHMRWEVEEFYKLAKSDYIGQRQFRSKTPIGIVQEIHALALFLSVSRYLMALAAMVGDKDIDEIGQKAAVLTTADYVVRIFLQDDDGVARQRLRDLLNRIVEYRYRRRPSRSFPRRSFKPTPKWGPCGRRGG